MMPLNTTYTLWRGVMLVNPTKLEDVDLNGCPKLSIKDHFQILQNYVDVYFSRYSYG